MSDLNEKDLEKATGGYVQKHLQGELNYSDPACDFWNPGYISDTEPMDDTMLCGNCEWFRRKYGTDKGICINMFA